MTPPAQATAPRRYPAADTARPESPRRRARATGTRRFSGPVAPAVAGGGGAVAAPPLRTARRSSRPTHGGAATAVAQAVGRLCDSRLLDRLVRGRFWIGFVAFALIGIVAMQLALLKLNTGLGRDLQRESTLQRQNADLEAEVSGLASMGRVQAQAAQLGMVALAPGAAHFLFGGDPQARRAAAALDAAPATPTAGLTATSVRAAAGVGAPSSASPSAAPSGLPVSSSAPATPASASSPSTGSASTGAAPSSASSTASGTPATSVAAPSPSASPAGASAPVTPPAAGSAGGGASAPVGG